MNEDLNSLSYKKASALIDGFYELHKRQPFTSDDIWRFFGWGYDDRDAKHYCAEKLNYDTRTKDPPTLKQAGKVYQVIDRSITVIPWKQATKGGWFDIKLPFGLEKYVHIYPKSIIVVGGVSNQGKTTFAHKTIDLNVNGHHQVILHDSENSAEELIDRLSSYPNHINWPEDFIRERTSNWADAVEPDAINIIDYLEVTDQFWLVGREIREIHDALKGGIAIVVLQKAEGSKLPLGRDFSRHLARLVITIDKGLLTIVKAKARADKTIDPNNMKFSFQINETGTDFLNIQRSYDVG